ncbi:MAG: hypothetical protein A3E87_03125 [Gammaproteobacteria bacterium RIFCSPHIGHO2_12_FULL_35_23]|nr:MAG: hypothetical protein A3E87_03125 [Gammaproteobacteria bacterium RIFCSPHIGHO2_12_FULL_35_23]
MNFSFLRPSRVIKGTIKTVANVPAWLGFSFLKNNTKGLIRFLRPFYKPTTVNQSETFAEATNRLNLTEQDLSRRQKNLAGQAWLFGLLSLGMVLYAINLIFSLHVGPAVLSLLISVFFFVKMCTCRFWIFQIKHRKLGCSVNEWLQNKVEEPKS